MQQRTPRRITSRTRTRYEIIEPLVESVNLLLIEQPHLRKLLSALVFLLDKFLFQLGFAKCLFIQSFTEFGYFLLKCFDSLSRGDGFGRRFVSGM